jgi:outer membrane protein insertion porin family
VVAARHYLSVGISQWRNFFQEKNFTIETEAEPADGRLKTSNCKKDQAAATFQQHCRIKGDYFLRFRPVHLVLLLWAGLCTLCAAGQQEPPPVPAVEPGAHGSGALNSLQGARVAAVRISGQGVTHPEWLEPLIVQKVNEPLDKYKVRQSVQALYDTGRFADIEVQAQPSPNGGVVLIFDARESFFFGSILVELAPDPPGGNQLINAAKLNLGERFTTQKIDAAIENMQRLLQDNGYYRAKINPVYDWDRKNQQVKVTFMVSRGIRARVGNVSVTGSPGFSQEQILSTAEIRPGNYVSADRLTRALRRLRSKYQRHGRLTAQVAVTRRDYQPESNTVDYTFDITQGPAVRVRVEGAALRMGLIKKYVPIYEENAIDDDLLNEATRNLRDYFQTKGYFDAKVTFIHQTENTDQEEVIFKVEQGELHKVLEIGISGNKYFSRQTIRERMLIQPAGGLLLHGLFSQSMLARDVSAIQDLYQSNGFLQVKVEPIVQDDYEGHIGQIKVSIAVEEGAQTLVGGVVVQGNSAVRDTELYSLISSSKGQPYADANVGADQTQITNYYFNHGFPQVRCESAVNPEPGNPLRMDIIYKITEGPQVFVDRILVSGLNHTRPYVVNREMALGPGDPLSQEQMLNSQQHLYDLGIFNAVDMAVQNPDGDATHKDLVYQLAEARRYTYTYGGGFEVATGTPSGATAPQGEPGASGLVSFSVTRLNFRGRDQTLTLQARYGNLQKRVLVGYESPRWFDLKTFTFNLTAFYDDTFDVSTFEAKRLEGAAELKERLSRANTLFYRLIYRRVSIPADTLVISPELIPLFSQPVRVGMPDVTFVRDTRDDPTDSHKGAFTSFDTGLASSAVGSQSNFSRVLVQNSTYYQFHKKRWVLARSTRVGVEALYDSTTFVPLPELFFAGGSNSNRGFGLNQAGPRDPQTGFPVGGQALFLNSLELRTPPLPLPFMGNDLSAVLFHDLGNVFDTPGDMVANFFRYNQPNREGCENTVAPSCSFNYMTNAIGTGIRYRTPIGPISFDLGYNVNPPLFPIAEQNRFESLGHFNFYFSFGQTF